MHFMNVQKSFLILVDVEYFYLRVKMYSSLAHIAKVSENLRLIKLTFKQMLQRLPTTLAQLKAGNASENLLNEIRHIIYPLLREKEITKKVCSNILNSVQT